MIDHLNWRVFLRFACSLLMLEAAITSALAGKIEYVRQSGPEFLSYPELVSLSEHDEIPPALNSKLTTLLITPFVNNEAFYRKARPHHPALERVGPGIRLVQWNIERGIELDNIKLVFTDTDAFVAKVKSSPLKAPDGETREGRVTAEEIEKIREELNPERGLFQSLQKFRFDNGTAFDFRGVKDCTDPPTTGTLADSNQRAGKGFTTTFQFARTFGPKGKFRLDWIFVRAYEEDPVDPKGPYRFAPHVARTLSAVNYAFAERISDHNPIVVDLPFRSQSPHSDNAATSQNQVMERLDELPTIASNCRIEHSSVPERTPAIIC